MRAPCRQEAPGLSALVMHECTDPRERGKARAKACSGANAGGSAMSPGAWPASRSCRRRDRDRRAPDRTSVPVTAILTRRPGPTAAPCDTGGPREDLCFVDSARRAAPGGCSADVVARHAERRAGHDWHARGTHHEPRHRLRRRDHLPAGAGRGSALVLHLRNGDVPHERVRTHPGRQVAVSPGGRRRPTRPRLLVDRPARAKKFNGTVGVESLNVSGGLDAAPS